MARKPRQRRRRGVLDVYDRDGRWWAKVPKRGRVALGLDTADVSRDEAYRVAAQRFASGSLDARAAEAGREGRLVELARLYITEQRHRWAPRHIDNVVGRLALFVDALAALGVRQIEHVTPDTLSRYVGARQHEGTTDAAINRTIQVARALARWAAHRTPPLCDEGALARWKNLREIARNADPVIPSPQEWARLVRELEQELPCGRTETTRAIERANARGLALLVAVAVQTGLRIDEMRHLRAEDIGADVVRVRAWGTWKPKDREERDVPVPTSVSELARELVAWRWSAKGARGRPLALCDHYVLDAIAKAWPRCGIVGPAPGMHDARRTFATEMSRRPGVSIRDVQRLLGHSSAQTTQRYLGRYRSDAARPAVDMGLAAVLAQAGMGEVIPMRPTG